MPDRHDVKFLFVRMIRGANAPASTYFLARWLFLRLLGLIFLIAFVSLWVQVHGLIGSQGILNVSDHLDVWRQQYGRAGFWYRPTLCWFNAGDTFLHIQCALGTILSLLLIAGIAPVAVLALLWMLYLSLVVIGEPFTSFQWDILLLETAFMAMFLAPNQLWPRPIRERPAPALGRWLLWWLLFKLMFLSGITKLLSGDPIWRDLSALSVHYETQPLPTWVGWYVHQLPAWVGLFSVFLMYVIEVGLPFLIFAPRRLRHAACAGLILLQVCIGVTGNYTFFNLLAVTLCVLLLDDHLLRRVVPRRLSDPWQLNLPRQPRTNWFALGTMVLLLWISGLTFVREMVHTARDEDHLPAWVMTLSRSCDRVLLSWAKPYVLRYTAPLRTISGYGLFRVMTPQRLEIVIEGSDDGVHWVEYEFSWKPGDLKRRPGFVQPHQPRLDWQMWFAALNPRGNDYWLRGLLIRLLEGSPDVLELFETNPFPDAPPRYVRLVRYHYEFTDLKTKGQSGAWWRRQHFGYLTRPFSQSDL